MELSPVVRVVWVFSPNLDTEVTGDSLAQETKKHGPRFVRQRCRWLILKETPELAIFQFVAHRHKRLRAFGVKIDHERAQRAKLWLCRVVAKLELKLNGRNESTDGVIFCPVVSCFKSCAEAVIAGTRKVFELKDGSAIRHQSAHHLIEGRLAAVVSPHDDGRLVFQGQINFGQKTEILDLDVMDVHLSLDDCMGSKTYQRSLLDVTTLRPKRLLLQAASELQFRFAANQGLAPS